MLSHRRIPFQLWLSNRDLYTHMYIYIIYMFVFTYLCMEFVPPQPPLPFMQLVLAF